MNSVITVLLAYSEHGFKFPIMFFSSFQEGQGFLSGLTGTKLSPQKNEWGMPFILLKVESKTNPKDNQIYFRAIENNKFLGKPFPAKAIFKEIRGYVSGFCLREIYKDELNKPFLRWGIM